MKDKKEKRLKIVLIVVMVILLLAILGVGGYGIYFYLQDSHSEPNQATTPTMEPTPTEPTVVEIQDDALMEQVEAKIIKKYSLLPFIQSGNTNDFEIWQKIVLTIACYQDEIVTRDAKQSWSGVVSASVLREKMKELFGTETDYEDKYSYSLAAHEMLGYKTSVVYLEESDQYFIENLFIETGEGRAYYPVPYKLTQQGDIYQLYVYRVFRQLDEMFPIGESEFTSDVDGENVILDLAGTKYEVPYPEMGENVNGYKITDEELKEEVKKVGSSSENMRTDIYTFQKVGENFYWTEYQENLK